jgi:hypothetical protein
MKKVFAVVLAVVLLATTGGVALAGVGNDLPSGSHYNLNLLGKAKNMPHQDRDEDNPCDTGNRIFVQLDKRDRVTTDILLVDSGSPGVYQVLDCDGTDGEASFSLPNPDSDNDGVTSYSVYIRLRGKPNGDIIMTTCGEYKLDNNEKYCSVLQVVETREQGHGKNKFNNVSAELLYIYAWVCTVGTRGDCDNWEFMRVPLFHSDWENFLWEYDNNGVKNAQLRFYEVPTTVPAPLQIDPRFVTNDGSAQSVPVTITTLDTNVDFQIGTIEVTASDPLTVSSATAVDAYTITATLGIPAGTADGNKLIWVFQKLNGTVLEYLTSFELK